MKLLEENIWVIFKTLEQAESSQRGNRTVKEKKKQNDKLYFIRVKNFHSSKGTINKMEKWTTDWEKIFAIHISDRKFVLWIYKNLQ